MSQPTTSPSRSTAERIDDDATAVDATPLRPLLVSIEDAAEILAVGRTSIYQLIWNDELEPIRIGRCLRFSVAQLEAFVLRRAKAARTG